MLLVFSRKEEAREREKNKKREAREKKEREAEDAYWKETDQKIINKEKKKVNIINNFI